MLLSMGSWALGKGGDTLLRLAPNGRPTFGSSLSTAAVRPKSEQMRAESRKPARGLVRSRVVAWSGAAILAAACAPPVPLPPVEPSPHVGPASTETALFTARLGQILELADIERETVAVDFAALDDTSVLGRGWALEPGLGQAWGLGSGSTLKFRVMPGRDLRVELRCAPFHFSGSPKQTVTVSVNGHEVETLRLWRSTWNYDVRVPGELLEFGVNEIRFDYGYSAVPSNVLGDTEDGRDLAVIFDRVLFGRSSDQPAPAPSASSDGTRLQLPFSTRVSYFLELGTASSLRLGRVEPSSADRPDANLDWRLRVEAAIDGSREVRVVELGPDQLQAPIEVALPTTETGQRTRVTLAAYSDRPGRERIEGLTLDLPEVLSMDEELAARLAARAAARPSDRPLDSDRPNIIVYMIDTLRADHLGAYGYLLPTSPNIDAFAAEATLFRRAVAQSSWTKPSVVSLITGLNPQVHGVNGRKDALAQEAVTLAERLWEAGWDTAGIYTNGNLSHMGLGQGYRHYQHLREGTHRGIHVPADELNEQALLWLDRDRDRSKPFFLYLHSTDPHSPYTPPDGYLERLGLTVEDPDAGLIQNVSALRQDIVDQEQLEDLIALYDAEIAFNDEQFGLLLKALDERGLTESTMVIVVSDHGEEFFDHGWWQHGKTLYQEQLGVPLIVRFPRGEGAGEAIDGIAQHIDIVPTVLDAAGLDAPGDLQGRSLRRLLGEGKWRAPSNAISYLAVDNRVAESVTSSLGKLILHHYDIGNVEQLYDLDADPSEGKDLYARRPVLAGYLEAALKAFNLAEVMRLAPEQGEFDPEIAERLRDLGYLN